MKKAAVMIYPFFSMQEISCLTDALALFYEYEIDVFASSKDIIKTEDGFQCVANKTFDEFNINEYNCLILPGIYNPMPALFDEKIIEFLRSLQGKDILIAAISSSPILLAKSGLLDGIKFSSGIFEEMCITFDFIQNENNEHQPVSHDKNFITAIGFAFREFAAEVIKTLGLDDCEGGIFNGVTREYTPDEMTYYMGEENFKEFMTEYNSYLSV